MPVGLSVWQPSAGNIDFKLYASFMDNVRNCDVLVTSLPVFSG